MRRSADSRTTASTRQVKKTSIPGCEKGAECLRRIVLRAFQGIGVAGVFNMSMVVLSEAVPPEEFPNYSALTAVIYTPFYGLGPLIGGGISSTTTWRWVFRLK